MDLSEVKQDIQNHLTDGLVTIVGSGLSVAEGLPGMGALATHLKNEIPELITPGSKSKWKRIEDELSKGTDLESTLLKHPPDEELETAIVKLTADYILKAEIQVINDVINNDRVLRFSKLLKHLLKPKSGVPVITTNYDRLIEIAAESIGLGVDSLFVGQHFGRLNPKESQFSLCRGTKQHKRRVYLDYCDHLVLLKPHGSLDWFMHDNEPVRSSLPLDNQRLIITPGLNKFRGGYNRPFDSHRERANKEIDLATRYLILGYGFNDDHLQTHLETHVRKGKPTLLITHGLSDKAQELLHESAAMTAITAGTKAEGDGARVTTQESSTFFPGANLWDLEILIKEVLEP